MILSFGGYELWRLWRWRLRVLALSNAPHYCQHWKKMRSEKLTLLPEQNILLMQPQQTRIVTVTISISTATMCIVTTTIRPLLMKIHQLRSVRKIHQLLYNVLDPKIHQLQCKYIAAGGFLEKALRIWWIFRMNTSQSVDFDLKGSNYSCRRNEWNRHNNNGLLRMY